MTDKQYTMMVQARSKSRHACGDYDEKAALPRYTIRFSARDDIARSQVSVRDFLMGPPGRRFWVYEIENDSTWPIFVEIYKDGELLLM